MSMYQTLLYYKYARIADPELFKLEHIRFCKNLGLTGRILVAEEGINGSVSGTVEQCAAYMEFMQKHPLFAGIEFKIDEVNEPSFDRIHVRVRPELVNLGMPDLDPNQSGIPHLKANEVLEMMEDPEVVFLDTRNKVEWEVGKFKNAVTLDIDSFRDFPDALQSVDYLKDKKVIAYCTGGIRCEKATMVMKNLGFKNVFQIDGGIFKYCRESGGKNWDGKMYVFDKRVAVDVNTVNPTVISRCRICNGLEDRLVNCSNPECNEHFVLCEKCGWEMEGACSETCKNAPRRRAYDGTGYYSKGPLPAGYN